MLDDSSLTRLTEALADRYAIERPLGEGGMATVYLARDLKNDRQVAIKVLKPELAAVVGAERFLTEIRTTANLQHPHILPLHDSGEAEGFLFYVMPFVDGESLRDRIDSERQLPVDEAVAIARKVAGALDHAHEKEVVHRDIKPANILMSGGEPLVADFGIALALTEAGGGRVTETGLSLGTPNYMSPEQAAGERSLDRRSDIYALGCVLYEMLTGEPPHSGPTAQSVLAKILTDRPRPARELRRSIPENVEAAIATALEKLPADRFGSARDFGQALGDPTYRGAGSESDPDPARGVSRARVWAAGLGGVVLGVTVMIAMLPFWAPPPPPPSVFRAAIDFPEGQQLINPPVGQSLALSGDGSILIYTGPGEGNTGWQLWVRRADELTAVPLAGTRQATSPVLSPDRDEVAFVTEQTLYVRDLGAGRPRAIAENVGGVWQWDENDFIYFGSATTPFPILRVRPTGGEPQRVPGLGQATDRDSSSLSFWGSGDILPGARSAVWERFGSGNVTDVDLLGIDLVTGDSTLIVRGRYPRYLDTGHLIWLDLDGRTLYGAAFDADRMEIIGDPAPLEEPVRSTTSGFHLAASNSGDVVYLPALTDLREQQLLWLNREGEATAVDSDWGVNPAGGGAWNGTMVSADGTRLVATVGTADGSQIWLKSLVDDSPPIRITFDASFNARPQWAPDDRSITYISSGDDCVFPCEVWLQSTDDGGDPELLLSLDREIEEAHLSPDGEWLVYRTGGTDFGRDIWAVRTDGSADPIEIAVGAPNQRSIDLSPDGRWLAYVSNETGQDEVFVVPFPEVTEGRRQISEGSGLNPRWSRSGDELFYVNAGGSLLSAHLSTQGDLPRVLRREELFPLTRVYVDPNHTSYDVGPDGRFLMYSLDAPGAEPRLVWVRNLSTLLDQRLRGR